MVPQATSLPNLATPDVSCGDCDIGLKCIKTWFADNYGRAPCAEDIEIFKKFLQHNRNITHSTKKSLKRYFKYRSRDGIATLFHDRTVDSEDILASCQEIYLVPLPSLSVAGRRMTIVRLPAPASVDDTINANAFLKRWLMIIDLRLRDESPSIGEIIILDVCDMQASHLKDMFKGSYLKNFIKTLKSSYPINLEEIHVINTHKLRTLPLLLITIGFGPWRRKLTKLHPEVLDLNQTLEYDYYPLEFLPNEYGGKGGRLNDLNDEWTKRLLSNGKWFESEERRHKEILFQTPPTKPAVHTLRQALPYGQSKSYNVQDNHSQFNSAKKKKYNLIDSDEGTYRPLWKSVNNIIE